MKKSEMLGFPSLSAWIIDLMQSGEGSSLRLRRVLSGRLGQIGGQLATFAERDVPHHLKREVNAITAQIARLQSEIIHGAQDAAEGD